MMPGAKVLREPLPRNEPAHAALLVEILEVVGGPLPAARDRAVALPLQALTETELRVLRFLPTNLSRSGIARELYLSVNTVNTHVRNIYAKLDARDRSTAVERARQLRLLSASLTH